MAHMAHMKRARLASIEVLADFKMRLDFVDGEVYILDFKPLFDESPGLARLHDSKVFATATLIDSEGWTVEWPDLDIQLALTRYGWMRRHRMPLMRTHASLPNGALVMV